MPNATTRSSTLSRSTGSRRSGTVDADIRYSRSPWFRLTRDVRLCSRRWQTATPNNSLHVTQRGGAALCSLLPDLSGLRLRRPADEVLLNAAKRQTSDAVQRAGLFEQVCASGNDLQL